MGDLRDLDAGQLLTVARRALVAPLGLELEDPDLRPALVAEHLGLDLDLLQRLRVEDGVRGAEEDRLEVDGRALVGRQALDEELLPLLRSEERRVGKECRSRWS